MFHPAKGNAPAFHARHQAEQLPRIEWISMETVQSLQRSDNGTGAGPQSLRYSVALEDGVTLKVMVEKSLADVSESSGANMVKFLKSRPGANQS